MEQRPLRLGDLVDDYCPRERRITNHAIVALVGEQVRQCRCTTCDAEHVYKGGKVPRRLPAKKDGEPLGQLVTPRAAGAAEAPPAAALVPPAGSDAEAPTVRSAAADDASADPPQGQDEPVDGWLAHRPLIRATLPRTEGDAPTPRPIPEFTMHQRQARGGRAFGRGHGWGGGGYQQNGSRPARPGNANGNANGNVAGNHDCPQGHGRHGPGGGRPGRHRGGGTNKRSR